MAKKEKKRAARKAVGISDVQFEELPLETQIDVGRTEAKRVTDKLREALDSFELAKRATDSLLRAGVTRLTEHERETFAQLDDALSTAMVKSVSLSGVLKHTSSKPIVPDLYPPSQIDPESDRATIIRELLAALKALGSSMEAISKATGGDDREYYVDGMCRASSILHSLLSPLVAGDIHVAN